MKGCHCTPLWEAQMGSKWYTTRKATASPHLLICDGTIFPVVSERQVGKESYPILQMGKLKFSEGRVHQGHTASNFGEFGAPRQCSVPFVQFSDLGVGLEGLRWKVLRCVVRKRIFSSFCAALPSQPGLREISAQSHP